MKYILFLSITFTMLFSQIKWYENYNVALKKAKEAKKPLFIFMERKSPPCRWCEKMKKETLNDEKISSIVNKNFIAVKIVRENKNYPSFLKTKFVPTIFILTHKEKPVTKIVGYWSVSDLESDLKYVLRKLRK